jgi:phage terminase small subunit
VPRGRKPMPNKLLQLHNTVRPHRHRKRAHEPQAPGSLAEPPGSLSPAAREHWMFAITHAPPILAAIDRDLLATWCEAVATNHEAACRLQQEQDRDSPHKLLVKTSRGDLVPSPYLRVRDRAAEVMRAVGSELGFSPGPQPAAADNPFHRIRLMNTDPDKPPVEPWDQIEWLQVQHRNRFGDGGPTRPERCRSTAAWGQMA